MILPATIVIMLVLMAVAATLAAYLVIQDRAGTIRLLLVPPLAGAGVAGLFALLYAVLGPAGLGFPSHWIVAVAAAAWIIGALLCADLLAGAALLRRRQGGVGTGGR